MYMIMYIFIPLLTEYTSIRRGYSVPACVVLKKEKSVFCQHETIAVVDFAEDGLAS